MVDRHITKKKEHVMDFVEADWRPDRRFALFLLGHSSNSS
jgi:hypothetical protein